MTPQKPYKTYAELVDIMEERGMAIPDKAAAQQRLRIVNYYRFSAYTYPFRIPHPDGASRGSVREYRSAQFQEGAHFENVVLLYDLDRKLRTILLEGVELIEVALRTKVSYTLGRTDPYGYLNGSNLHPRKILYRPDVTDIDGTRRPGPTRHESWKKRFNALVDRAAKTEDFIVHYRQKHQGALPIWVAAEVLDFGALADLYQLMDKSDQNQVASELGIKGGGELERWLIHIKPVRNQAAHHARLWNRRYSHDVPTIAPHFLLNPLPEVNHHEAARGLYYRVLLMAYLIKHIDPQSQWLKSVKTQLRKFANIKFMDACNAMGMPKDWDQETFWA